jgi:hypothetical protein
MSSMKQPEIWCGISEIQELSAASRSNGSSAYVLLLELRREYAEICRAHGTFKITPKTLARTGSLHGWTRERYEKARDVLLKSDFIVEVETFKLSDKGPRAARYMLTSKGIEPVELTRVRKTTLATSSAGSI